MWQQAEASWDGDACAGFEVVADALEGLPESVHVGLGEVADVLARAVGLPEWSAMIIRWLVAGVALPYANPLLAAAQVTRVFAVVLCADHGTLDQCVCLPGLARGISEQLIADRLENELKILVR